LSEVEYFLEFSYKQNLIEKEKYDSVVALKEECGRILWSLYQSQR